jgi:hypothetical protein
MWIWEQAMRGAISMSKRYELVKQYYDAGLWGKKWVRDAVIKGWVTIAEYWQITGEEYVNEP